MNNRGPFPPFPPGARPPTTQPAPLTAQGEEAREAARQIIATVAAIPTRVIPLPHPLARAARAAQTWQSLNQGEFPGARGAREYAHSTVVEALKEAFKELEPRCNRRPYRRARHAVREHLRTILRHEGQEYPPLNRVLPQNVLGKEFHCQQVVAIRRNEVVRAMATGDVGKVARQYLNQRGWLLRARVEASVAPLFGGTAVGMGIWKATVLAGSAAVAAETVATAAVSGGVNLAVAGGIGYTLFRNERRSAKTLRYAAQWLEARLGPLGFAEIAKLPGSATDEEIQAIVTRYSAR